MWLGLEKLLPRWFTRIWLLARGFSSLLDVVERPYCLTRWTLLGALWVKLYLASCRDSNPRKRKAEVTFFYDLITDILPHHFCHTLFVTRESQSLAHSQGEGALSSTSWREKHQHFLWMYLKAITYIILNIHLFVWICLINKWQTCFISIDIYHSWRTRPSVLLHFTVEKS